jgi:hypothetical protein
MEDDVRATTALLASLPERLSHSVMAPLASVSTFKGGSHGGGAKVPEIAFVPARLERTNEVLVRLGRDAPSAGAAARELPYFARCTTFEARRILAARLQRQKLAAGVGVEAGAESKGAAVAGMGSAAAPATPASSAGDTEASDGDDVPGGGLFLEIREEGDDDAMDAPVTLDGPLGTVRPLDVPSELRESLGLDEASAGVGAPVGPGNEGRVEELLDEDERHAALMRRLLELEKAEARGDQTSLAPEFREGSEPPKAEPAATSPALSKEEEEDTAGPIGGLKKGFLNSGGRKRAPRPEKKKSVRFSPETAGGEPKAPAVAAAPKRPNAFSGRVIDRSLGSGPQRRTPPETAEPEEPQRVSRFMQSRG